MKTLSLQAEANRFKDGVGFVWCIDAAFDMYGQETKNVFIASCDRTVDGRVYDGLLAKNGLGLSYTRLRPHGGIPEVGTFTVRIVDLEGLSAIEDTHVLFNDPVILYGVFIDGSEMLTDRIELMRGVMAKPTTQEGLWIWSVKDNSKKKLTPIPNATQLIGAQYPGSQALREPLPQFFGHLMTGPHDGAGSVIALAPCTSLDKWTFQFTSSFQKKSGSTPYQWYAQAGLLAEVLYYTEVGGVLKCDQPEREVWLLPNRPKTGAGGNNKTDWRHTADGDDATAVILGNGDILWVYVAGSGPLGTMTGMSIHIPATGSYTLTIFDDLNAIHGPTLYTHEQTISLVLADFKAWNLSLLNVKLEGPDTGTCSVQHLRNQVAFDDPMNVQEQAMQLYQKGQGWQDQTAYYQDGAVIDSAGAVHRNPAYILATWLRGTPFLSLPVAEVDLDDVATAATLRNDWHWDFFLKGRKNREWLSNACFQAGFHLFDMEDQWHIAVMDKMRVPDHFWHGDYDMPVKNAKKKKSEQRYDFERTQVPADQIVNEIVLRFAPHPATGVYQDSVVASGQYRLTGTCAIVSMGNTATITDISADFVAQGVSPQEGLVDGERIYLGGVMDVEVTAVNGPTQLTVQSLSGSAIPDETGVTYYLGPHIREEMFVSQQAYHTVNPLGGKTEAAIADVDGVRIDLIYERATALKLLNHEVEWRSQPRWKIRFPLSWSAVDVDPGDFFLLEHQQLPASRRPMRLTTLAGGGVDEVELVWTVATGTAGLWNDHDYALVVRATDKKSEVVQVVSVDMANHQITVIRGQLNTEAIAHAQGLALYRLTVKWMVMGVRKPTPTDPWVRIEAVEVPPSYKPIGRVVADGFNSYQNATPEERAQAGFATLPNGRIVDTDADSALSFVG